MHFVRILHFFINYLMIDHHARTEIRAGPKRSVRSDSFEVVKSGPHVAWFKFPDEVLSTFTTIISELHKRSNGDGAGSLFQHHIADRTAHTRAQFFECTSMISPEMISQMNQWLSRDPDYDGIERRCVRGLANFYGTTLVRSSKDCDPLLKPHRDNVNDADATLVIGITPTTEYRGAVLYVSNIAKEGKIWFEREGVPSRKSVQSIDMCKGVCVILKNNAEHYVSALQSGKRGSLVFHMSPK